MSGASSETAARLRPAAVRGCALHDAGLDVSSVTVDAPGADGGGRSVV